MPAAGYSGIPDAQTLGPGTGGTGAGAKPQGGGNTSLAQAIQNDPAKRKQFIANVQHDPAKLKQFRAGVWNQKHQGTKPQGGGNTTAAPNAKNPPGGNTPPPGGTPPSFQDAVTSQFGTGNPFGLQDWYGDNPLQTAQAAAQRTLDANLAGLRSRFGAGGLGNSDRAALAEGQAVSDTATNLGNVLATLGQSAYQGDANRALSAILGAGQLDLGNNQLALAVNQQLGGFGTGLTGIGAQETQLPNLGEILSFLGLFQSTGGTGANSNSSRGGWWT